MVRERDNHNYNSGDKVNIDGDYYSYIVGSSSYSVSTYSNGTLTIGGNITTSNYCCDRFDFKSEKNHVVILKGKKLHTINLCSTNEYIENLIFTEGATFKYTGQFRGIKLSDDLTIEDGATLHSSTLQRYVRGYGHGRYVLQRHIDTALSATYGIAPALSP